MMLIFLQGYVMASTLLQTAIKGINIPVIFQKEDRLPLRSIELIFKTAVF